MARLTVSGALRSLEGWDEEFRELFSHGSMSVEIYRPDRVDRQYPHDRDELYVIASGSGYFIKAGIREKFETGEVLFVPAGVEHRFEDFSEDFAAWVIFYGPQGGESA